MNLSIFTDFTKDISFEKRVKLIKSAGFNGVLMFWNDSESFEKNLLIVKENGLRVENVHCPFHMLNNLWTDTNAAESLLKIHGAINSCHNFGIKNLVIHCTDTIEPPPVSKCGIMYFQGIVRYAKEMNVNLAFENIERPEYLQTIFTECDNTNVKFCYDIGHENCFSKGTDCLNKYADRLCALHIHDNTGDSDGHMLPFDGNIDFDIFTQKLAKINYCGSVSLEVMKFKSGAYENMTNEEYISKAFEAAKRLWEMREQYK